MEFVGVGVAVGVPVAVGELLGVSVGELLGVELGVPLGVAVGELLGELVGDALGVPLGATELVEYVVADDRVTKVDWTYLKLLPVPPGPLQQATAHSSDPPTGR
jgi:hypothetical protein